MADRGKFIDDVIAHVPGFLGKKELMDLYDIVSSGLSRKTNLVEVGSWCGRSSIVIGRAARNSYHNARVHCVDLFPHRCDWAMNLDGSWSICIDQGNISAYVKEHRIYKRTFEERFLPCYRDNDDLLAIFRKNIATFGLGETILPFKGTLDQFLAETFIQSADFIFIDADHDYDAVRRDLRYALSIIAVDGILCIDDVTDEWFAVKRAVNEILNRSSIKMTWLNNRMIIAEKISVK